MSVSERVVHVVEPTLESDQGHCMGLVRSLCDATRSFEHVLWVGRGLDARRLAEPGTRVQLYFHRRLRKLQLFALYRQLLRRPGAIVATTAGRIDLLALNWAASDAIAAGKVFLYFHWLRLTPRKRSFFEKFARRHPNVVVLATTPSVQVMLRDCGFRHALTMPYPVTSAGSAGTAAQPFTHLLFAGAARSDKGFSAVVDLVQLLAQRGESIPVSVQTSADHYEKYDARTPRDLERLSAVSYAHLTVRPATLSAEQYDELFAGAICLQLYDREQFADRVSGVTLDALLAGAPVATLSRTWIARLVERYAAGVVVEEASPTSVYDAVRRIIDDYSSYQQRARAAGVAIRKQGRWKELIELLPGAPSGIE